MYADEANPTVIAGKIRCFNPPVPVAGKSWISNENPKSKSRPR
jgi:hypothetical protein